MTFNINLEVVPGEAHSELLNQIELAELEHDDAQAARTGMNAALSFFNVVGDAAVDPAVRVSIKGEAGKSLTVRVEQVALKQKEPSVIDNNVPSDDDDIEEPKDKLGYAVAGQTENPGTGDPLVDNIPGHPDAPDPSPSVPEPQELQDPQVIEMLDEHDANPELVDVENPLYHTSEEGLEAIGDTEGVVVDLSGNEHDILKNVGDDHDKAQAAYDAELASEKPRKGLVSKLEKTLGIES